SHPGEFLGAARERWAATQPAPPGGIRCLRMPGAARTPILPWFATPRRFLNRPGAVSRLGPVHGGGSGSDTRHAPVDRPSSGAPGIPRQSTAREVGPVNRAGGTFSHTHRAAVEGCPFAASGGPDRSSPIRSGQRAVRDHLLLNWTVAGN